MFVYVHPFCRDDSSITLAKKAGTVIVQHRVVCCMSSKKSHHPPWYTGWWFGTIFYFPIYWEFHHPIWRTPWFFRGVYQPPTSTDPNFPQEDVDLAREASDSSSPAAHAGGRSEVHRFAGWTLRTLADAMVGVTDDAMGLVKSRLKDRVVELDKLSRL